MIKVKRLIKEIHDADTISPRDIFNLYYLEFITSQYPQLASTPYGKETVNYYLGQLKQKYVRLFRKLLFAQLQKYLQRARIDPDFDKTKLVPDAPTADLRDLMYHTYRSDMKRRNVVWNAVADYTYGLDNATKLSEMFININGLNNAVHNTGGKIIDDPMKVPNFRELRQAFDAVAKLKNEAQWELIKGMVDKDIRDIKNQASFEEPVAESNGGKDPAYQREMGRRAAINDRLSDQKRDLSKYTQDFQDGYKQIVRDSWWQKFNDRMTDMLARMGSSRLR